MNVGFVSSSYQKGKGVKNKVDLLGCHEGDHEMHKHQLTTDTVHPLIVIR